MKIALFSPYLPNITGGGERYLFDVALALLELGHQVEVAISSPRTLTQVEQQNIRERYQKFLGSDLSGLTFIATPLHTKASLWRRYFWTTHFDVLYYITNGSWFVSGAKHNIMHIQTPLSTIKANWWGKFIAHFWLINANSEFTRQVVEQKWGIGVDLVHQPKLNFSPALNSSKKEKIILNVGRFFRQLHSKRQDVLVDMFGQLRAEEPKLTRGWQLVLIGAAEDPAYANKVAKLAKGLPVKILHDVDRPTLLSWYQRASIYWHAAGFDIDESREPEKVEHFGIATLEAMSQGAIPVVHGKGGQTEVVGGSLANLTWQTQAECLDRTTHLLKQTSAERLKLAKLATSQAALFDSQTFTAKLKAMLEGKSNG